MEAPTTTADEGVRVAPPPAAIGADGNPPRILLPRDGSGGRKRPRNDDDDDDDEICDVDEQRPTTHAAERAAEKSASAGGDGRSGDGGGGGAASRQAEGTSKVPTPSASSSSSPKRTTKRKRLIGLRLEAIFHPKFDNEDRTTLSVRRSMLDYVSRGKGYLELTPKHSGSLLLWSGGCRGKEGAVGGGGGGGRFYSKNSTDNDVTRVGELLLRQHFARAWWSSPPADDGDGASSSSSSRSAAAAIDEARRRYDECSACVSSRRLTLSFELVTSILGDHGDVPQRDFLVLTSVADRSTGAFYSTEDVMSFAHRFRLPHNDAWVLYGRDAAARWFDLYDESLRETGTVEDVEEALDRLCCNGDGDGDGDEVNVGGNGTNKAEAESKCKAEGGMRVRGMHPHATFQGNLLEGIVVRYVPYDNGGPGRGGNNVTAERHHRSVMERLASNAARLLQLVPPDRPPSYEMPCFEASPVLSTNVRDLFEKRRLEDDRDGDGARLKNGDGGDNSDSDHGDAAAAFARTADDALRSILAAEEMGGLGRRIIRRVLDRRRDGTAVEDNVVDDDEGEAEKEDVVDVPSLVEDLLRRSSGVGSEDGELESPFVPTDEETLYIARLVQTLCSIRAPMEFKVFQEDTIESTDGGGGGGTAVSRWLCIIHVFNDVTFQKYRKASQPGDMPLYRGFCLRLLFEGEDVGPDDPDFSPQITFPLSSTRSLMSSAPMKTNEAVANGLGGSVDRPPPLMLKMKFLPYMIRTFGCRNGLNVLSKSGPEAFDRYASNLLHKWGVAQSAIDRWQPFLHGWGRYAHAVLREQERLRSSSRRRPPLTVDCAHSDADGLDDAKEEKESLPPLCDRSYLAHLEHFRRLYESGRLPNTSEDEHDANAFRGLVAIVGPNKERMAFASDFIAEALGGCRRSSNINNLSEEDMLSAVLPGGTGLVVDVRVDEGFKKIQKLTKTKRFEDAICIILLGCGDSDIEGYFEAGKERKKCLGMLKGWRKCKCHSIVDLPQSGFSTIDDDPGKGGISRHVPSGDAFQGILRTLRDMSDSLSKPDGKPCIILFFPAIPGSGKSTLCEALTDETLRCRVDEMKLKAAKKGPERKVIVRVGDKVQEKYWPLVQRELLENPSSIYVADKNAPPPAWKTVADICSRSRAFGIPVVPDSGALSTTIVDGIDEKPGVKRQHCYPFSLHYLAVCMARVLGRPMQSHGGKLDAATGHACMIVVKFYSLYRNISAERFLTLIRDEMDAAGAPRTNYSVTVPFFALDSLAALPHDLEEILREAIRLQYSLDCSGNTSGAKLSQDLAGMEQRLRRTIDRHAGMLQTLTSSQDLSRNAFLSRVAETTDSLYLATEVLDNRGLSGSDASYIKIVSIDVDVRSVHQVLERIAANNSSVLGFLEAAGGLPGVYHEAYGEKDREYKLHDESTQAHFILATHVTMAHFSQAPQIDLRTRFGAHEGSAVDISVCAFLFCDTIAAFSVTLPQQTSCDRQLDLPPPHNEFPHITVWCGESTRAVASNNLPEMVKSGKAHKVDISVPVSLRGVLRFWRETSGIGVK